MQTNGILLYSQDSNIPIMCERDNWKRCPEHKHLSVTPPTAEESDANIESIAKEGESLMQDDPNDDIVSVNEYAPRDVLDKYRVHLGDPCQQCGKNALEPHEVRGGLFKRKVLQTLIKCSACGYLQKDLTFLHVS
jgi:hypothetical protein